MPVESKLLSGYNTALRLAAEQLAKADPAALAKRCGANFCEDSKSLVMGYLGRDYSIEWPSGNALWVGSDGEVPITTKVLLLSYVLSAHKQLSTGELLAFRDIPNAATYEPSFQKRAVNPLAKAFDGKPELLLAAAEKLGGTRAQVADIGVCIRVLPLLPVTYGVWHGDEEFPASGVILFDSSARRLLTVECLVVAASNGVYELMKVARSIG